MPRKPIDVVGATNTKRSRRAGPLVVVVAMAVGACAPARSPADRAAEMERATCGPDVPEASITPLFERGAIESVEPLFETVADAELGREKEVVGAIVHVRALKGVTPEWLDRALECHNARRTLGTVPEVRDDPFWIPDGAVEIDVTSARDGFRVTARGHDASDAQRILTRAHALVGGAK
jgi:hypothetical protein